MNHQNCVGRISDRIIIIPDSMAMTAKIAQGPFLKKIAPSIRVISKHYAGGKCYMLFIILPKPVFCGHVIQTYI